MMLEEQVTRYSVGNLNGMLDYANALRIIAGQLGNEFGHRYEFNENIKKGVLLFASPVEIDLHPLKSAGYIPKKLPPAKQPNR